MISGFEWLNKIFDYLWQFVPQPVIVDTRLRALKWTTVRLRDLVKMRWDPSAKLRVLEPGFHVYWPLFSVVETLSVKRQTAPLPIQVVTTTDGKKIAAGGVLTYDLEDAGLAVGETHDTDDTIRDVGATCLHDALADRSSVEILSVKRRVLNTVLKNAAKDELKIYGARVIQFRLTTLAETRVYRLMQSTAQEGEIK